MIVSFLPLKVCKVEWGSRMCVWDIRFCHRYCSEAQKESQGGFPPTHSCPNLEERPQRQSRKGRILASLRPVVEPQCHLYNT